MKIEIHDVDHGGCVVVTSPTGERLMLDCGYSLARPWFPSIAHSGERIETLMLLNLDEDHVEDLESMWKRTTLGALVSNPTIDAAALRAMKPGGMRSGVLMAHSIFSGLGHGFLGNWNHPLGGVHWHAFWNRYGEFTDTNNLSIAVFVTWGGFTALFGGDLETAGWKALLLQPEFRARLPGVNLLVASHHGRENGKCDELFQWCRPELVVFSDGAKMHSTQETVGWYARKAKGIPDPDYPHGLGRPTRYVMTTRSDGTVTIDVGVDGRWSVRPTGRGFVNALSGLVNYQDSVTSGLGFGGLHSPQGLSALSGIPMPNSLRAPFLG